MVERLARVTPYGYVQMTDLSAAVELASIPTRGATQVYIVAEAQAVRWRDDGEDPTATVGQYLAVGVPLEYKGDMRALRFIEATSGAILNVSYYG